MLLQDLQKLMQETARPSLNLSDVEKISRLVQLADKVSNPEPKAINWLDDMPRRIGRKWLDPITIGKAIWFDKYPIAWFHGDATMLVLSLGFVISRGVSIDTLSEIRDAVECSRVVSDFWKKADCTFNDLFSTLQELTPGHTETNLKKCETCGQSIAVKKIESDYGPVIRFLVREFGGNPHYWMHEESMLLIENMITSFVKQQAEELKQNNSALARAGARIPTSPLLVAAIKEYREAINSLRESWATKT
jgi:hypothetical protein